MATTFDNVDTEQELRDAIFTISNDHVNEIGNGPFTINITGDITLTQSLPMIRTVMTVSAHVTINGGGFTIDANSTGRVFFIESGKVAISELTIVDAFAKGGDGGDGSGGAGGGLGAGAAIFVDTGASLTISDVEIQDASAAGGAGGEGGMSNFAGGGGGGLGGDGALGLTGGGGGGGYEGSGGTGDAGGGGGGGEFGTGGNAVSGGGGGGGQQGDGGSGSNGGGGGGGAAATDDGGNASGATGGTGGGAQGGDGGDVDVAGQIAQAVLGGGGGGGGNGGDFFGAGGGNGTDSGGGGGTGDSSVGAAGDGGLGGGGGGAASQDGGAGGDFGGGGGTGNGTTQTGGDGGFGGGGGGARSDAGQTGGDGGFGGGGGGGTNAGAGGSVYGGVGGAGDGADGGGGAALGGAIFVRGGGSLTINGGSFAGTYSVTGGTTGGDDGATAGHAHGGFLFLEGASSVIRHLDLAETHTIAGSDAIAGDGGLATTGEGTLELTGTNTAFIGFLDIQGGTLKLGATNATGSAITTLSADVDVDYANAIDNGGPMVLAGDSIQLNVATGAATQGFIGESTGQSFGFEKTGAGTLILDGNNDYSGTTNVAEGTLMAGATGGFSSSSAFRVAAGATLDINGHNVTIFSLDDGNTGGGTVTNADTVDATLTIDSDGTTTTFFTGTIQDGDHVLSLTKAGTATFVLQGTNTYTGATTVNGGLLRIVGSIVSATTVNNGALGGNGTAGAVSVAAGGSLGPGNSTGILTTGNVSFASGAEFAVEMDGTGAGTGYDQLKVNGTVSLGSGNLDIDFLDGFAPSIGNSFTIIDNNGTDAVAGTFNGLAEGATFSVGGTTFKITYDGGTGNDVVLTASSPLPPSGVTIIGTDGNDLVDATHTVAGQPLPTAQADDIKGLSGKDSLSGLGGADTIRGQAGKDSLFGGDDGDKLKGGKAKDGLFGDAGDDLLDGGAARDTLTGGEGDDTFVFAHPNKPDKVTDFSDGDFIALAKSAFSGIGKVGPLQAKYFHAGAEADTKKQHILYDEKSGWLSYAEKGSKTADPLAFAKVGKHLDLDHTDILVI